MSEKFSRFSFSLGSNDDRLSSLLSLFDKILCSLSLLLSNLFLFNSLTEFNSEMEISNRYIIEHDIEISKSQLEAVLDALTDLLSLCDQLVGVVASHHRLENLMDNRWQYSSIVIHAQVSVDGEKFSGIWSEQNSKTHIDGLKIYHTT